MEGNYLTSGDLALMESRRYYGGGDYYRQGRRLLKTKKSRLDGSITIKR